VAERSRVQGVRRLVRKYYPEGDIKDYFNVAGYLIAEGVVHVLKACGDDLSART